MYKKCMDMKQRLLFLNNNNNNNNAITLCSEGWKKEHNNHMGRPCSTKQTDNKYLTNLVRKCEGNETF